METHVLDVQLPTTMQTVAETILIWIGFGTTVGLLAKAIMPGRDPGGPIATLAMGVAGTVIGCGVLAFFIKGQIITPISPLGMVVGTVGAFTLLFFYKMLAGYWFFEGHASPPPQPGLSLRRRRPVRRRRELAYDEEL